jgi:C4-dicarboxylate-specific signal transduction histidine kinase
MRLRIVLVLLLCALTVLVVTASAWLYERQRTMQALKHQAAESLSLKNSNVIAEVARYRYLPFVLGQDERVQRLLDVEGDQTLVDGANKYLETINASAGSSALFLLNAEGTALASSNWQDGEYSFVGKSYAIRPYFKDALISGEGRYYAVGITTGKPGYFLSRRIKTAAGNLGVAVVKVDMSVLEKTWTIAGERVGLIDSAGVIFLSSVDDWKYRPLFPLSSEDRERMLSEHQYPPEAVNAPPLLPQGRFDSLENLRLQVEGSTMLLQFTKIPDHGWRIVAAYDLASVSTAANLVAAIVFLAAALLCVLGFYLLERRQRDRANQLREILENMSAGIAVFDPNLRLVAWNSKYAGLNSYPESLVSAGRTYAEIIRFNIERGDYGPGDPKKQLRERLDRARQQIVQADRGQEAGRDLGRNPAQSDAGRHTHPDLHRHHRTKAGGSGTGRPQEQPREPGRAADGRACSGQRTTARGEGAGGSR